MTADLNRRRLSGDDGFEAIELAVVFPVLIVLMLLVVFAGRGVTGRNQVEGAARAGARAASQARDPHAAVERGAFAARASIDSSGADCDGGPNITVNVEGWAAGGAVTVTVACTVRVADLGLLDVGRRTVTASATETVDTYRRATP